jgi:hypothetical protein
MGGGTGGGTSDAGFQPANLISCFGFEPGWGPFTDWGGNTPSGVTRDMSAAHTGSWGVLRTIQPNPAMDVGAQLTSAWSGGVDRVWVRFYFRLTANISSIWKWSRLYDPMHNDNFGGLFVGSGQNIIQWGWDAEDSSITTYIGLSEAQVLDGQWHSIEYDYWRNGDPSGFPSVAFWFDGQPLGLPDGHDVHYWGAGNNSYWSGGRLYAGERDPSRQGLQLGLIDWVSTQNAGNTSTGECDLDDICVSSAGRIGP